MKRIIVLLHLYAFISLFLITSDMFSNDLAEWMEKDNCLTCHLEMELMPDKYLLEDIHMQKGLSCAGCHGGDPSEEDMELSMSVKNNFIGIPDKKSIPQFCGKCHSNIEFMRTFRPQISTDQEKQFFTSIHGKKLKEGDNNVADCASCHTSHSILPAKNPRSSVFPVNIPVTCNNCHGDEKLMSQYNIATNQYTEFAQSVHGIALLKKKDTAAPACNNCHGNHGAMPPEIKSISHICGSCHLNNMKLFESSDMAKEFSQLEYHACEQCHGYHNIPKPGDYMIGGDEQSICLDCHTEDDEGIHVAVSIREKLDAFVAVYDSAQFKLNLVQVKGMNDIDIEYILKDAKQKLIESRTAVHSFDPAVVEQISKAGMELTEKAIISADNEMDEYYRRREGFIFASIAFLIFGAAIYLKIRSKNETGEVEN